MCSSDLTSSLRTNVTSTHPPTLPPLNITPLDIRPVYPPVSHRAGPQLFSTVYEDTASERTGSFVTAPSDAGDPEDTTASPTGNTMDVRAAGPSGSTTLYSPAFIPNTIPDPFTDSDRSYTTTPPSGSGISGAQLRPQQRGSGTSDTFILRRLTFGSSLSRPSFSAARTALATRLPPLPVLLFWAGFLAPWCWLIGGWLIAEGRWEESGKARAALPLWRPRTKKDLEKGGTDVTAPRRRCKWTSWNPFTPRASTLLATLPGGGTESEDGGAPAQKEKVVTFVKPYSAEVWVYRCRLSAVISAVMLLTALIVTLVIVGGSNQ